MVPQQQKQIILVQQEPRGPSQLIEVPVTPTSNGSKIPFPDIQQLKSDADQVVIIKTLRLITVEVLARGVLNDLANAPLTELQKISLILYSEGWEKGENIPILSLNDIALPGGTFPHTYHQTRFADWKKVDWTKSYLIYGNGTTAVPSYVVMLDCEYQKFNNRGQEIKGIS